MKTLLVKLIMLLIAIVISTSLMAQNNCLDFDGSNDYVDLSNSSNLKPTTALSFECWINPDNWIFSQNQNFAGNAQGGGYNIYIGYPNSTDIGFAVHSDGDYKRTDADITGFSGWHHIAGTFDGRYVKLYIDGELMDQNDIGSTGNTIYYNSSNSTILGGEAGSGSAPTGNYYAGKMDEVRFWNDARSQEEIQEYMCRTLAGTESNLVAYYRFNESSGTNLRDITSNSLDGTLTNFGSNYWVTSEAFTTWDGSENSIWSTADNWSNGVPGASDNVGILSTGNSPTLSTEIELNNLVICNGATLLFNHSGTHTIHGSAFVIGRSTIHDNNLLKITRSLYVLPLSTLTIEAAGQLSVGKKLDNWGTLNVKSNASSTGSLIVGKSFSGDDITFKRYVDETAKAAKWHYISSPVDGQALAGWMSANSIAQATNNQYQFYRFDEETDYWIHYGYTGTEPENFGDATFVDARGYAATRTAAGTYSFTGTVRTNDVTYAATYTAAKGHGFNLVGNPFTSTIAITTDGQATDNFLADNSTILDANYQAVYIWDESTGYTFGDNDYSVICNSGFSGEGSSSKIDQDFIQPGQAFMVRVKQNGNIVFNKDTQKHGAADFYKSKVSWPGIELKVSGNSFSNSTVITFNENMTLGLDPSYDVGKLKGNPNIALYTKLIEDNGVDFAIQALPTNNSADYIIPVGLDILEETLIEFSINTEALEETDIIFEDRENGSFTDLKKESYSATVSESGTGRFFLHIGAINSIENPIAKTNISAYFVCDNLIIKNPENQKGEYQLFDLHGKIAKAGTLNGSNRETKNINIPTGVYILKIKTNLENRNVKIVKM